MPGSPEISVNKLGEYLTTSNAARRRTIIRQQKNPPDAIVPRYRQAAEPIRAFLESGGSQVEIIHTAITQLRTATAGSEWVANDNECTAQALETFLDVASVLPIGDVVYVPGEHAPPKLEMNGVKIRVRPDFLLRIRRRSRERIGALKIHYIKGDDKALKEAGQQYVATLCHQWLLENGPRGVQVSREDCYSLDVFRRSLVRAPAAVLRRMNEVMVGCSDIALIWPAV